MSNRTLLIGALVLMAAGLLLSDVAGPLLDQPTAAQSAQQPSYRQLRPGYPGYAPGSRLPGGGFFGRIPRRGISTPSPAPSPNA
ncbi:MAG TPA: hypothetical protein VNG93_04730 [Candidatus Dormibacteraeota bacterium]|nr:hypothetical protein [Candidatus Dormibacteraeota bacterium]